MRGEDVAHSKSSMATMAASEPTWTLRRLRARSAPIVGEALAAYLQQDRLGDSGQRRLFLQGQDHRHVGGRQGYMRPSNSRVEAISGSSIRRSVPKRTNELQRVGYMHTRTLSS